MSEAILSVQNWNMFASSLIIDTCVRFGADTFFISPGYRDAPFIAALSKHQGTRLISCFDERAAAFQALGWAKAKRKPAVLLCTSGTAGANYLPAVIEAKTDHIPLLVITADRPFELVHANAQQVIDQRDLFGRFVKKSLDFPAPSPTLSAKAWVSYTKMLLELSVDRLSGPVHLNLPFHAPLDPIETENRPTEAHIIEAKEQLQALHWASEVSAESCWSSTLSRDFQDCLTRSKRGLLILGRLELSAAEKVVIRMLRDKLQWPVFADVGSGLKYESSLEIPEPSIPSARRLLDSYAPDMVLHIGKRLVTRHLDDVLNRLKDFNYWVLTEEENVQDPYHLSSRRQYRPDWQVLESCAKAFKGHLIKENGNFSKLALQLAKIEGPEFHFGNVANSLRKLSQGPIFLGNSTAIRAFDSWCFGSSQAHEMQANRGVSGIEGLLATTIGLSLASRKLWTLVVGDISLLHDLNSVISLAQSEAKVIVVLVNNLGGRIFESLPVQAYPWVKDPLISTPHALNFQGIAAMARLPYSACKSQAEFEAAYSLSTAKGESCIIECQQGAEADLNYLRALRALEFIHE